MSKTITYLYKKDFYKTKVNTPLKELTLDNFLIDINLIGISDEIWFVNTTNKVKRLK